MGLKRFMVTLALGGSLILGGCQQTASNSGEPSGQPTSAPAVSSSPEPVATPEVSGTPSESGTPAAQEGTGQEIAHTLSPLPGKTTADVPKITKKDTVKFQTTAGEIVIEVYPDAAPNAAQRFVELVESGFYDDTPVSRVVPNFVAQFGVNWRDPHKAFKEKNFDDDPTHFALDRGTVAFAKAGPNTNSTQVFINFRDNSQLASPQYNFTTFGKVVQGMEIVDKFVKVGDPQGGLDQARLWADGASYLEALDTKPTMIEKATVVK